MTKTNSEGETRMTTNIKQHMSLLGIRVTDKVTGFTGVVSSVCFDLYGCIQAAVNPGLTSEGRLGESHWFDVNRLNRNSPDPVMDIPDFDYGPVAEGRHGPADKPIAHSA